MQTVISGSRDFKRQSGFFNRFRAAHILPNIFGGSRDGFSSLLRLLARNLPAILFVASVKSKKNASRRHLPARGCAKLAFLSCDLQQLRFPAGRSCPSLQISAAHAKNA